MPTFVSMKKLIFIILLLFVNFFLQGQNLKLWGTTEQGGSLNYGTIYYFDVNTNTFTKVFEFYSQSATGKYPTSRLVQGYNGKLYGTTVNGGANNVGALFEFDPATNSFQLKKSFGIVSGTNLGIEPFWNPVIATDGKIYGVTLSGGTSSGGTLFAYDIGADSLYVVKNFGGVFGSLSKSELIDDKQGNLFGVTNNGGIYGEGALYKYNYLTNTASIVFSFRNSSGNSGKTPVNIVLADNGKIYGATIEGGTNNLGVLFVFDTVSQTYTKIIDFNGTNGGGNAVTLFQANNGKIYGTNSEGGIHNHGVLFELDINTNTYSKLFDFDSINGSLSYGKLMQASNGKIYGVASRGGINDQGTLFEYDIQTNTFAKLFDFDTSASFPAYGDLLERCFPVQITDTITACKSYTWRDGITYTASNNTATFTKSDSLHGCDSTFLLNLTIISPDTSVTISGDTLICNASAGNYQWLDCDNAMNPIQGANQQTFVPANNGSYAVEVNLAGCKDTSACHTVIVTGVYENSPSLKVFPNPVENFVNILSPNVCKNVSVLLFDARGRKLREHKFRNLSAKKIKLPQKQGTYFLVISYDGEKTETFRIVKH